MLFLTPIVCPLCPITNQPQLSLGTLGYVTAFLSFCSSSLGASFPVFALTWGSKNTGRVLICPCLISSSSSLERSLNHREGCPGGRASLLQCWTGPPYLSGWPSEPHCLSDSQLLAWLFQTQSWPWRTPRLVAPPASFGREGLQGPSSV